MAQQSSQQKKSLIVLAGAPGRLQEFERFLGRRGWEIRIRSDLKTALVDLTALKPSYVLISADFSHPNLEHLRRTMAQVYRVTLIDFTEEQTIESWAKLKAVSNPHKIFGNLTGPAFERALSRMQPGSSMAPHSTSSKHEPEALRLGTNQMMRKVFNAGDGAVRRPLSWTNRVTCVEVRSSVISGHFLIAAGSEKALDENLSEIVRSALSEMMNALGYDVDTIESFPLDMRRVEFKRWADESADFLERGLHQGVEIAMAFFPVQDKLFDVLPSVDPLYFQVDRDEIRPDARIDFELFLHLPLNGKYIMYVSQGGWLSLQQQMSLQSRGIVHLHVRQENKKAVLRDRTARHFDHLIAHYYENRVAI
jgi:hypothetical protein